MTVCLVLQGDSASPGARERMCSGCRCWRRPTPSTRAGSWGARGPPPLPQAAPRSTSLLPPGCSSLVTSKRLASLGVGLTDPETDTLVPGLWLPLLLSTRCAAGREEWMCVFFLSLSPNPSKRDFSTHLFFTTGDRWPLAGRWGEKRPPGCEPCLWWPSLSLARSLDRGFSLLSDLPTCRWAGLCTEEGGLLPVGQEQVSPPGAT